MALFEASSVAGLDPSRIVPGARFEIRGAGFPLIDTSDSIVAVGGASARVVFASRERLVVEAPLVVNSGRQPVTLAGLDAAASIEVAAVAVTGVHQVDSPLVDSTGCLYCTYSGTRGQESSVSIFRVTPEGVRETFVTGIVNATSMAFGPGESLYVSSRFDGTVSRVHADGRHEVVASDLGRVCGLAFAPDGTLFAGDRSGTIFHVDFKGTTRPFATLPPSVAAFHLALGPDARLYVTAPTLAPIDHVYAIDALGRVETLAATFGRPQGLAFDSSGTLHIVEALAGSSGVYRLPPSAPPTLAAAGRTLVGITFAPSGEMVVCSSDTIYRFE